MINKLSIIIPAYNEEATIQFIFDKVLAVKLENNLTKEIIVINDCSSDRTEEKIQEYMSTHSKEDIKYFKHDKNQGKGAAVRTGFKKALSHITI